MILRFEPLSARSPDVGGPGSPPQSVAGRFRGRDRRPAISGHSSTSSPMRKVSIRWRAICGAAARSGPKPALGDPVLLWHGACLQQRPAVPPRPQACQHLDHAGRHGQDRRFRPGRRAGPGSAGRWGRGTMAGGRPGCGISAQGAVSVPPRTCRPSSSLARHPATSAAISMPSGWCCTRWPRAARCRSGLRRSATARPAEQWRFWQEMQRQHAGASVPRTGHRRSFPIIERCLGKEPGQRYQSFQQVRENWSTCSGARRVR